MTSKHHVTEEIFTYEYLWRTGDAHLTQAKLAEPGDEFDFNIAALLFYYLAYEGFINFSVQVLLPELWQKEREYFKGDKAGIEGKVAEIVEKLNEDGLRFQWEKGQTSYQRIKRLEKFRDAIAHGKVIVNKYETISQRDGSHIKWQTPWDELTTSDEVIKSKDAIKLFCESLRNVMRQCSDHPHLNHVAFEGPFGNAKGGHP